MQTANALRLVEPIPFRIPVKRRVPTRSRPDARRLRVASGRARRRVGSKARAESWLKPVVMALIVVGEWLVLLADVFVRIYIPC